MHSLTDGTQTKTLYIDFAERYPEAGIGIVGSLDNRVIFHMTDKEHVKCVNVHARISIDVGNREEVLYFLDAKTGLFPDLADNALFARFLVIDKTAGQVKGSLGRLLASTDDEQFAPVVQDEGRRGRTGILVIGESTVRTMFALKVVLLQIRTSALRTELEDFQWMIHICKFGTVNYQLSVRKGKSGRLPPFFTLPI